MKPHSVAIAVIFVAHLLVAPARGEPLVHEVVIPASIEKVWRAFTVAEEIEQWMVPNADIDFRVGGTLRTSYSPEAALDGPEAIEHTILAYEPHRMLAMRVTGCPDGFEFADEIKQTWEVLHFTTLGPDQTHIRAVGLGYGEGGKWDTMRTFFDQGNTWTYEQLRKHFTGDSDDAAQLADETDQVLALLHAQVGGEWIHESTLPDGSVFRVRNVVTVGPDGKSLFARGWLGNADGMFEHGLTTVYRAPESAGGGVRFLNVNEQGAIATGSITLTSDATFVWDWNSTQLDGSTSRFRVESTVTGPDTYRMVLSQVVEDGTSREMINLAYERVDRAPDRFLVLESGTH